MSQSVSFKEPPKQEPRRIRSIMSNIRLRYTPKDDYVGQDIIQHTDHILGSDGLLHQVEIEIAIPMPAEFPPQIIMMSKYVMCVNSDSILLCNRIIKRRTHPKCRAPNPCDHTILMGYGIRADTQLSGAGYGLRICVTIKQLANSLIRHGKKCDHNHRESVHSLVLLPNTNRILVGVCSSFSQLKQRPN